jgi:hypothetical protein
MANIYTPPRANISGENGNLNTPHLFWKVFFWINTACIPLIILAIAFSESIGVLDYIDLVIFPFILLTLFGYVFSKKIGPNFLWRLLCILYPAWFLFYEFVAPIVLRIPSFGENVEVDACLPLHRTSH